LWGKGGANDCAGTEKMGHGTVCRGVLFVEKKRGKVVKQCTNKEGRRGG